MAEGRPYIPNDWRSWPNHVAAARNHTGGASFRASGRIEHRTRRLVSTIVLSSQQTRGVAHAKQEFVAMRAVSYCAAWRPLRVVLLAKSVFDPLYDISVSFRPPTTMHVPYMSTMPSDLRA